MLIEFSDSTATLLKRELPRIGPLFQTNEDENTLDLANIKQLTGCRTGLVQECLTFIQELDALASINFFNSDEKKNYPIEARQLLIEGLKKYITSCERYPRTKDFLNIIPDNTSGMVSFTIIVSTFLVITYPPLAIIPVSILFWVFIDLLFNNRESAKNLKETLINAENELRTIKEAHTIFKNSEQKKPSETQLSSLLATPSTSREYHSFSETDLPPCRFFNAATNTNDIANKNSKSSSLSLTSSV